MRVAGSDVEMLRKDGNWQECKAHPLCEVGAFLRTSGVSSDDVTNLSRESLERELLKLRLEGFSLAADGVGVRAQRMNCVLWPRSCMKQEGITRVKVPHRVMFDLRTLSSGHEVEQVEMEDERSESQEAHRPRRIPSPMLPSSEEVDAELDIAEEKSGAFPMTMMDYGNMYGVVLGAESEASQSTGAVGENVLPILVMKNKRSETLSASFVLAKGVDGIPDHVRSSTHTKNGSRQDRAPQRWGHSIVLLKKNCGAACSGSGSL